MAGDGVRVRVISNDLGKLAARMPGKAEQIVSKAALDVQAGAQRRAPVDTGNLRASIIARRVGRQHWQVRVGAEYGIYVERGTRYMRAQPYLEPAVRDVERTLRRALEKLGKP